jgi:small subunit ribosomal protein S7
MPRKYVSTNRFLQPDPRHQSKLASKFINCLMSQGRKAAARKVLYEAFESLTTKVPGQDPLEVFSTAIGNVKPLVEVRSRRVGGATLQVPHEIKRDRQQALAIRWIIQAARDRSGHSMKEKLSAELMDAFNRRGNAVKKREDTHKMADANKAFAHYRW